MDTILYFIGMAIGLMLMLFIIGIIGNIVLLTIATIWDAVSSKRHKEPMQ